MNQNRTIVYLDDSGLAQDMQRQHGKVNDVDKAKEKDMLLGTFVQLDGKGKILEGGIENRSSISIEFIEDKKT